MKIALKNIIAGILILQVFMLPMMTKQVFAASPFESTASPLMSTPASAANNTMGTAASYSAYQSGGYFTDSYGNILMNVNVWGSVNRPGPVVVPEGADIALLLSLAGGPADGANLKKIRVNRAQPDESGKMTYRLNLETYAKEGDRSMLMAMQPNDTVIIPKSKAIDFLGVLGVIGAAVGIYSVFDD